MHKAKYEDMVENVDIAIGMDIALKYAEDLKIKYPYLYGDEYGVF